MSAVPLDASVLVSVIVADDLSTRADKLLFRLPGELIVSDFAEAEFASALARRVRQRELTPDKAREAFALLDGWLDARCRRELLVSDDIAMASVLLRRLEFPLRTPDALHFCMARRLNVALATFDTQLARVATGMNLPVLS